MKKFVLFLLLIMVSSVNAFADDSALDSTNWGISPHRQTNSDQPGEAEEAVWEGERDEYIYNNYGEEDSSAYMNRSKVDAYESNHGGDAFDLSN